MSSNITFATSHRGDGSASLSSSGSTCSEKKRASSLPAVPTASSMPSSAPIAKGPLTQLFSEVDSEVSDKSKVGQTPNLLAAGQHGNVEHGATAPKRSPSSSQRVTGATSSGSPLRDKHAEVSPTKSKRTRRHPKRLHRTFPRSLLQRLKTRLLARTSRLKSSLWISSSGTI